MFNFPLTHFKFKFGIDYNLCHPTLCHFRPCNSLSVQQSSSVRCARPHLHTCLWPPHYLPTCPFSSVPCQTVYCLPDSTPVFLLFVRSWAYNSLTLTTSFASAGCLPPNPTFITGQVNIILSHLPVSWAPEFKPHMSGMDTDGYLMLTLNNKVGGSFKWTTWKGCDAAGVRACISLFHIFNDQRLFFNLHSALQKRLLSANPQRITENNNDDFLSSWWLERPHNLSDFGVLLSRDEITWQGDIMPDVSSHCRRDFDILWFKNW